MLAANHVSQHMLVHTHEQGLDMSGLSKNKRKNGGRVGEGKKSVVTLICQINWTPFRPNPLSPSRLYIYLANVLYLIRVRECCRESLSSSASGQMDDSLLFESILKACGKYSLCAVISSVLLSVTFINLFTRKQVSMSANLLVPGGKLRFPL